MTTSRVSVNIDEDVKLKAQRILNETGLDMATAIDLFLRTVVRDGRIPFDIYLERIHQEAAHSAYINAALGESMLEANDPTAKRYTHAEIMVSLKAQREARKHV